MDKIDTTINLMFNVDFIVMPTEPIIKDGGVTYELKFLTPKAIHTIKNRDKLKINLVY